jgi:hypothetical protein
MVEEKKMRSSVTIAVLLTEYLEKNPNIRFTQALFNLGINEFDKPYPEDSGPILRDPYNDPDEIVEKKVCDSLMRFHEEEIKRKRNNTTQDKYNPL